MIRRRLTIALAVLLALSGVTAILWYAVVPPGPPPAGGPTGRTKTVAGMEFAEVGPGSRRIPHQRIAGRGDTYWVEVHPEWFRVERPFWIGREAVGRDLFQRFEAEAGVPRAAEILSLPWAAEIEPTLTRFCEWLSMTYPGTFLVADDMRWGFAVDSGAFKYRKFEVVRPREEPRGPGLTDRSYWEGEIGLGTWSRGYIFRMIWIPSENPD